MKNTTKKTFKNVIIDIIFVLSCIYIEMECINLYPLIINYNTLETQISNFNATISQPIYTSHKFI